MCGDLRACACVLGMEDYICVRKEKCVPRCTRMAVGGGFLLKKAAEPSWGEVGEGKQEERGRDRAKSPIYLSRKAAVHEKSLHSSGPGRLEGLH